MPYARGKVKIILRQPRKWIASPARAGYTARMAEQEEDFNAFNSLDSAGAVLMLGIAPAVMNYIFFKEEMTLTCILGAGAVGLAALVYLLFSLTGWRVIGSIVNLVGCILVPIYLAAAIWLWCSPYAPTARAKATPPQQPAAEAPATPEQGAQATPAAN